MDDLLNTALLGTARKPPPPVSDHPVDHLAAGQSEVAPERMLLLRAGAWSVYRTAGYVPAEVQDLPGAAPDESLPECSRRAAEILLRFLGDVPLALEAFERLRKAGRRVPFELLPRVLDLPNPNLRSAIAPVLGQRGRWLAQFNDAWRWGTAAAVSLSETLPTDAETIWQEGTPAQRREVLARLRAEDPARAREWLAAVWSKEKVDQRAEFLEAFRTGLGPGDEPMLEQALADRSARVKAIAATLLARLPDSGFATRMRHRADAMLLCEGPVRPGALTVRPPTELEKDWQRDGVVEKPPPGVGKRAWWLGQVIALVPPSHWQERFSAAPAALIEAAAADEFGLTLWEAWSRAAVEFGDSPWMEALWDAWYAWKPKKGQSAHVAQELFPFLFERMESSPAARRMARWLEKPNPALPVARSRVLGALGRPWSVELGRAYLAALAAQKPDRVRDHAAFYDWLATLPIAARRLPEQCFSEVLDPGSLPERAESALRSLFSSIGLPTWGSPEQSEYTIRAWRKAIDEFREVIRLRQEFAREVPVGC
ncbi:MAG: DUF5691 domain-containing protein [Thermoguttaceae bacterium]|jgi:hypothetical protein|nr:DUF5691 domain-containing protein [Thermoguttaceae bacterium]